MDESGTKQVRLRDSFSSRRSRFASSRPTDKPAIEITSPRSRELFDYLVDSFIEDYMRRKYALEKSGWRNLAQAAHSMRISSRVMYGRSGGLSPLVNDLIRRGVVESRIFPGERGRGGQISKLRVSYDRRPVQELVDSLVWGNERIEVGAKELDSLRVAVLPLGSLSPDPKDEYFADGLTDEIISTLSRIPELQVISRTSVTQYKKNPKPIKVVAKELGVGTILEGTVRKQGARLRVSVQTIDAARDRHLWSEDYDKELRDVFIIQTDIARRVADSLRVRLLKTSKEEIGNESVPSTQAYDLYLKGRHYLHLHTETDILKAVKYFELATEEDPNFALAFAALAKSYASLDIPQTVGFSKARKYARQALTLDKNLPEGHAALGMLAVHARDWLTARRELKRAIELNPSFSEGYKWYGEYLEQTGRAGEAFPFLKMAEDLDPLAPSPKVWLSVHYFASRRYAEAEKKSTEAVSLAPLSHFPHMMLGFVLLQEGRLDEGVAEMRRAAELARWAEGAAYGPLGYAYGVAGRSQEALLVLKKIRTNKNPTTARQYEIALVHLGLRQYDLAVSHLEKSMTNRESVNFPIITLFPTFDPIRDHPRYTSLLGRMGLGSLKA